MEQSFSNSDQEDFDQEDFEYSGYRINISPFLDVYDPPKRGELTEYGQPLKPIQIPAGIKTLINRSRAADEELEQVDVGGMMRTPIRTPVQPVLVQEGDIGIEINLDVLGDVNSGGQINPSDISNKITSERRIPTNYSEARDNLHLIVPQRSGGRNANYKINEIKRIAKNLGLPSGGNKDAIVNRIRRAVIEHYQIQSD